MSLNLGTSDILTGHPRGLFAAFVAASRAKTGPSANFPRSQNPIYRPNGRWRQHSNEQSCEYWMRLQPSVWTFVGLYQSFSR